MTTVTDDFAGTGSLGANWTDFVAGISRIAGSAVGTASTDCASYYTGASFGNDQSAEATITVIGGGNQYAGVTVRMSGSGGYGVVTDGVETLITAWPGPSVLLSVPSPPAWVVGDKIKLGVVGTTLTVYRNGSAITGGSTTDSSFSSGSPGLETFGIGAVDDFTGTDAGAATVDNPRRFQDGIPAGYFADPGWAALYGNTQLGITVAARSGAASTASGDFSSTDVVTVTGTGASAVTADFSESAVATVTGTGAASVKADFNESAVTTVTGVGRAAAKADFSETTPIVVTGAGAASVRADFSTSGVATVTGAGAATVKTDGNITGLLTMTGTGASSSSGAGDGSITIVETSTGAGASGAKGDGLTLKTSDRTLVLALNYDGDFVDVSAYGHVATVSGATTSSTQVKAGSAAGSFTTAGQSISYAVTGEWAFNTTDGTTWETWVYATTVDATRRSIWDWRFDGSGAGTTMALDFTSSDLRLQIGIGSTVYTAQWASTLTVNTWQHVAGVVEAGTLRLYVDGTQVASAAIPNGILNGSSGGSKPMFGRKNDATQNFGGFFDLTRIHGSVLYPGGTSFTPDATVFTSPIDLSGLFGVGATSSPTVVSGDGSITVAASMTGAGASSIKGDGSISIASSMVGVGTSSGPIIVSADGGITITSLMTGAGASAVKGDGYIPIVSAMTGASPSSARRRSDGKKPPKARVPDDDEELFAIAQALGPLIARIKERRT